MGSYVIQYPTTSKWQNQDSNPGSLTPVVKPISIVSLHLNDFRMTSSCCSLDRCTDKELRPRGLKELDEKHAVSQQHWILLYVLSTLYASITTKNHWAYSNPAHALTCTLPIIATTGSKMRGKEKQEMLKESQPVYVF